MRLPSPVTAEGVLASLCDQLDGEDRATVARLRPRLASALEAYARTRVRELMQTLEHAGIILPVDTSAPASEPPFVPHASLTLAPSQATRPVAAPPGGAQRTSQTT